MSKAITRIQRWVDRNLVSSSIQSTSGGYYVNLSNYYTRTETDDTFAPLASPTFVGHVTMPGTGIWNSSGSVGIGTTSPDYSLHVKKAADSTYIKVERGDRGYILIGSILNSNAIYSRNTDSSARNFDILLGSVTEMRIAPSEAHFQGDVIAYSTSI